MQLVRTERMKEKGMNTFASATVNTVSETSGSMVSIVQLFTKATKAKINNSRILIIEKVLLG
jgi:hypothetical protein